MNNSFKHNGFYKELETIWDEEDEAAGFEFLENLSVPIEYSSFPEDRPLSAFDFLHGFCFDFAIELSKKYKYTIENVFLYDNSLKMNCDGFVHCYCTKIVNGKKYYIDVRGITDDADEFWSEFEDEIVHLGEGSVIFESYHNPHIVAKMRQYKDIESYFKKNPKHKVDYAKESEYFLNSYCDYYNIDKI